MPFDTLRGFQTGQQVVGPSAFGTFINQLTERANQMMGLRLQSQAAGMTAEQQTLGQLRAYASPEAEALRTGMMGRFTGGISSLPGPGVPTVPTSQLATQGVSGISPQPSAPTGFQAQYGYTGENIRIDPMTGFPTKTYEYGQTPESKVQQGIAEDVGKKVADIKLGSQILQSRLGLIEQALQKVPPPIPSQLPGSAIASSVVGRGRRFLGRADPNFRQTTTLIEGSIGPFLTTVEGLSRGRLTQGEINYLSNLLRDLPYLDANGRQERLGLLKTILQGNMQFGEPVSPQQSSPFQQSPPEPDAALPTGFRQR